MLKEFTSSHLTLINVCHATERGFYGFLGTIPAEVRMLILEGSEVSDSFVEIMKRHSVGKVLLR